MNNSLLTPGAGTSRAAVLTSFAESAEHINNIAVAIHTGIYDLGEPIG